MAKDPEQTAASNPTEQQETITGPEGQQPQTQLQLDESGTQTFYSSTSRVSGSAEEITVDFSQGIRPGNQPNVAVMKVDSRVILSPWGAKRLALALSQSVQRYEQAFGTLEIDPRKRRQNASGGSTSTTSTT